MDIVDDFVSELKSLSTYELLKLLNDLSRDIEKYGEVWRLVAGRRRSKAPGPSWEPNKAIPGSRVHDFRRSRKKRARSGSKVST